MSAANNLEIVLRIRTERDASGLNATVADVQRITTETQRNTTATEAAGRATGTWRNSLRDVGAVAAGAFAGWGIAELASKIFEVNTRLNATRGLLQQVEGDAVLAGARFLQLGDYAIAPIVGVDALSKSFVRLKNLGLDANESIITSFANIAAANDGKTIKDFTEAFADAATGEFERLKEFGIKASAQGDAVAFTFQNVTTTVKNNADAIQGYLVDIGNTKFGDAVSGQLATIDGASAHLGNSLTNLFDDFMSRGVNSAEELTASFINGAAEMVDAIDNIPATIVDLGSTTATVGNLIEATWITVKNTALDMISDISGKFPLIANVTDAVSSAVADSFSANFSLVGQATATTTNVVIGGFNAVGNVMGIIAAGIVNNFSEAFEKVKAMSGGFVSGVKAAMAGDLSFTDLSAVFSKQSNFSNVAADVKDAMSKAFNVDYVGNFKAQIKSTAADLHSLNTVIAANARSALAAKDSVKSLGDAQADSAATTVATEKEKLATRKSAMDAAVSYVQSTANQETAIVDNQINQLDRLYKNGQVSVKAYFEQSAALITRQSGIAIKAVNDQLAIVEREINTLSTSAPTVNIKANTAGLTAEIGAAITAAAAKYKIDPNLIRGLISHESGFNPNAMPPIDKVTGKRASSAKGLMQLVDGTSAAMGYSPKDMFDVAKNIDAGTKYLAQQLATAGGDVKKGLAAYYAGWGNINKNNAVAHTGLNNYAPDIMRRADQFAGGANSVAEKDSLDTTKHQNDLYKEQQKLKSELLSLGFKESQALAGNEDKLLDIGRAYEKAAMSANDTFDQNVKQLSQSREALASTKSPMTTTAYTTAIMAETEALYDAISSTQSEKAALSAQKEIQKLVSEARISAMSEIDKLVEKQERLNKAYANAAPEDKPAIKAGIDAGNKGIAAVGQKEMDDYSKKLDEISGKTKGLGATNSAVFDGALGGINTLAGAFDNLGKSIGENTEAQKIFGAEKSRIDKDTTDALKNGDATAYGKAVSENTVLKKAQAALDKKSISDTLSGTRQVVAATANMFEKKSTAYKALHGLEQGIAAAQMAMQAVQIAQTVASIAPSVAGGVAKLVSQGGWVGFAGAAAFLALMAGLGYAGSSSGGSSVSLSQERQTSAGTGTVLGDSTAKSESINKSIDILEKNSTISLPVYHKMLDALIAIKDSFTGLSNQITREFDVKGTAINPGAIYSKTLNSMLGDFKYFGGLVSSFIGQKVKMEDYGYSFKPNQSLGGLMDGKDLSVSFYNDLKKSTTIFGMTISSSMKRVTEEASDPIKKQFTDVFLSQVEVMQALGEAFGLDAAKTNASLRDSKITIPDISLKDLKPEEMATMINNIFSASLDKIAGVVLGGIDIKQYQNAGEGLLETAVRVATGLMSLNENVDRLGISSAFATTGVNGMIAFSQELIHFSGGMDKLSDRFNNFFDRFYSDAEKSLYGAKSLTNNVAALGLAVPVTRQGWRDMVNGELALGETRAQEATKLLALSPAAADWFDAVESYRDTFTSSADKATNATTSLNAAVALTGQAMPATRQGWLDMTDAQLAMGDSGRTGAVAILNARDAADNYYANLEKIATDAQKAAEDAAKKAVTDAQTAADAIIKSQKSVNTQINELNGSDVSNSVAKIFDQVQAIIDEAAKNYGTLTGTDELRNLLLAKLNKTLTDPIDKAFADINSTPASSAIAEFKANSKIIADGLQAGLFTVAQGANLTAEASAIFNDKLKTAFKSVVDEFNGIGKTSFQKSIDEIATWRTDTLRSTHEIAIAQGITDAQAISGIESIAIERNKQLRKEYDDIIKNSNVTAGRANDSDFKNSLWSIRDTFISTIAAGIVAGRSYDELLTIAVQGAQQAGRALATAQKAINDTYTTKSNALSDQFYTANGGTDLIGVQKARAMADLQSSDLAKQAQAVDALISLNNDRYSKEIANVKTLGDYVHGLYLNSQLSILSPTQKLDTVKADYEKYLAGARAGDQASIDKLGGAADAYLNQQQALSGSKQDYARVFGTVAGQIEQIAGVGKTDDLVKAAQLQQVKELQSLQAKLDSVTQKQTSALVDAFNQVGKDFTDSLQSMADAAGLKVDVKNDLAAKIVGGAAQKEFDLFKGAVVGVLASATLSESDAAALTSSSLHFIGNLSGLILANEISGADVAVVLNSAKVTVNHLAGLVAAQLISPSDAVIVYTAQQDVFNRLAGLVQKQVMTGSDAAAIYTAQADLVGSLATLLLTKKITVSDAAGLLISQNALINSIIDAVDAGQISAASGSEIYAASKGVTESLITGINTGAIKAQDVSLITGAVTDFSKMAASALKGVKLSTSDSNLYSNAVTVMSTTLSSAIGSQRFTGVQLATLAGGLAGYANNPAAVLGALNFKQADLNVLTAALTKAAGNPAEVFRLLGFTGVDKAMLAGGVSEFAVSTGNAVGSVKPGDAAISTVLAGVNALAVNIRTGVSSVEFLRAPGDVVRAGIDALAANIGSGLDNIDSSSIANSIQAMMYGVAAQIANISTMSQFDTAVSAGNYSGAVRIAKQAGYSNTDIASYVQSKYGTDQATTLSYLRLQGYATGGDPTADYYIAGENGAELIANGGNARVFNANQTKDIFSGNNESEKTAKAIAALAKELADLKRQQAETHLENRQLQIKIAMHLKKIAELTEKADAIGPRLARVE